MDTAQFADNDAVSNEPRAAAALYTIDIAPEHRALLRLASINFAIGILRHRFPAEFRNEVGLHDGNVGIGKLDQAVAEEMHVVGR